MATLVLELTFGEAIRKIVFPTALIQLIWGWHRLQPILFFLLKFFWSLLDEALEFINLSLKRIFLALNFSNILFLF
mgnify:CR=1 FL=1